MSTGILLQLISIPINVSAIVAMIVCMTQKRPTATIVAMGVGQIGCLIGLCGLLATICA